MPLVAEVAVKKVGDFVEEDWATKKAGAREMARSRREVERMSLGGKK